MVAYPTPDFSVTETPDKRLAVGADGAGGAFSVVNDGDEPRAVTIRFVAFALGAADRLEIVLPDGRSSTRVIQSCGHRRDGAPGRAARHVADARSAWSTGNGNPASDVRIDDLMTANADVQRLLDSLLPALTEPPC